MSYKAIIGIFCSILILSSIQLALFLQPKSIKPINISFSEMQEDLQFLLSEVEQHSAFISLKPDKISNAIKQRLYWLEARYPLGINSAQLGAEITKILALLNDPASFISVTSQEVGVLPLKLRPMGNNWLALNEQDYPIDNEFPFITHIDGLPMSTWEKASKKYQPEVNNNKAALLYWLQQLDLLRQDIGLEVKPEVNLTLTSHKGVARALKLKVPQSFELTPTQLPNLISIPEHTNVLQLSNLKQFDTEPRLRNQLNNAIQDPLLILDLRQAYGYSDYFLQIVSQHQPHFSTGEQLLGLSHYRSSTKLRNDFLRPINFVPIREFPQHTQRSLHEVADLIKTAPIGQEIINSAPLTSDTDKSKPSSNFSPWFARTIQAYYGKKTQEGLEPSAHHLAIIIGPSCRQDCAWLAHLASSWPNTLLIGEPTSGDLTRKYHFTLPNSRLDAVISASLIYDSQGKRISGVPVMPDVQISLEQEISWPGLLALLSGQNQAQVAESKTKPNPKL